MTNNPSAKPSAKQEATKERKARQAKAGLGKMRSRLYREQREKSVGRRARRASRVRPAAGNGKDALGSVSWLVGDVGHYGSLEIEIPVIVR